MSKARSRLSAHQIKSLMNQPFVLVRYAKQFQTLFLTLPFYFGVYWHLRYISPAQIRDILVPNSYLPLQIYLFIGNFFLFSFLWLNTRRGFLTSIFIGLTLFFKLQSLLNWWMLLIILAPILVLEILATLLEHR